jgi:hypothetical protein
VHWSPLAAACKHHNNVRGSRRQNGAGVRILDFPAALRAIIEDVLASG